MSHPLRPGWEGGPEAKPPKPEDRLPPGCTRVVADPLTRAQIEAYAVEHDIELILLDPPEVFDAAIVGIVYGFGQEEAVLYDYEQCIAGLVGDDMDREAAEEFFDFNTVGAYVGAATPRFLIRFEEPS